MFWELLGGKEQHFELLYLDKGLNWVIWTPKGVQTWITTYIWLYHTGYATLVIPHWLYHTGYATLVIPHWLYHTGYTTLVIPHWLYHTGYATLVMPHWLYHTGYTTLVIPHWLYHTGYTTTLPSIIRASITCTVVVPAQRPDTPLLYLQKGRASWRSGVRMRHGVVGLFVCIRFDDVCDDQYHG